MKISIIAARAKNDVIGNENQLPWRVPEDLAFFKKKTMGHAVLMGRKTFESITDILKGRRLIVVTKDRAYRTDQAEVVLSIEEGLALARSWGEEELFVAGGESIYRQTLLLADHIFVTEIGEEFDGSAYFPAIDPSIWRICRREEKAPTEERKFPITFTYYEKRTHLPKCNT